MRTIIKHISILLFIPVISISNLYAFDKKYESSTYILRSSEVNGENREYAISPYREDKVVYLQEESGKINAYVVTIGENRVLTNPQTQESLDKLAIQGTVAYDSSRDKLYYPKKEKKGNLVLYESQYKKGEWKKPKRTTIIYEEQSRLEGSFIVHAGWRYLPKEVKFEIQNPTMSKNGNRIYFTSGDLPGTRGGKDLWYIDRNDEKTWNAPVNLGIRINSVGDEDYAFLEGDSILYFSRKDTSGIYNLYVSKQSDDGWNTPMPMDAKYTSSKNDYNLIVMQGAPYLISDRITEEQDNIFYLHELKIDPLEGLDEDKQDEKLEMLVPWQKFKYVLFQFDFDLSHFKEEYRTDLNDLIKSMKNYPDATFRITGHTDERGSEAYNMRLSHRRAESVKKELEKAGFRADRLVVVAKGKSEPVYPNAQNEEEHYANRRVEVTIIEENSVKDIPIYEK